MKNPRGISRIFIIAGSYPSSRSQSRGIFVRENAIAMAREGLDVTVISPVPVHDICGVKGASSGNSEVTEIRPVYLSLSTRRVGAFRLALLTQRLFEAAVLRVVRRTTKTADAVYGHFLFPAGAAAVRSATVLGCPSFIGVGEGRFWTIEGVGRDRAARSLARATGFAAVSRDIASRLVEILGIPPDRVGVFPNGVDLGRFKPHDRRRAREVLGLSSCEFIVVFTGALVHGKGPLRLAAAAQGIEGLKVLFAGEGPEVPTGPHVHRLGHVPHEQLPIVLSAGDVFALPTTHEGSCNAIVEAMACGLPVVSSIGSFNDDLMEPNVGIRVDPMDVAALRRALIALRDDAGLRATLAGRSLRRANELSIQRRVVRLTTWMAEVSRFRRQ